MVAPDGQVYGARAHHRTYRLKRRAHHTRIKGRIYGKRHHFHTGHTTTGSVRIR